MPLGCPPISGCRQPGDDGDAEQEGRDDHPDSDSEWYSVSHDGWGFVKYASEKVSDGDLTVTR